MLTGHHFQCAPKLAGHFSTSFCTHFSITPCTLDRSFFFWAEVCKNRTGWWFIGAPYTHNFVRITFRVMLTKMINDLYQMNIQLVIIIELTSVFILLKTILFSYQCDFLNYNVRKIKSGTRVIKCKENWKIIYYKKLVFLREVVLTM